MLTKAEKQQQKKQIIKLAILVLCCQPSFRACDITLSAAGEGFFFFFQTCATAQIIEESKLYIVQHNAEEFRSGEGRLCPKLESRLPTEETQQLHSFTDAAAKQANKVHNTHAIMFAHSRTCTLPHGVPAKPVTLSWWRATMSVCVLQITATLTLQIISEIPSIAVLRRDKCSVSNNNHQVNFNQAVY